MIRSIPWERRHLADKPARSILDAAGGTSAPMEWLWSIWSTGHFRTHRFPSVADFPSCPILPGSLASRPYFQEQLLMSQRLWNLDVGRFTDANEVRYGTILFAAFCLTVPTYAWFGVADGIVPLWVYIPILVGGGLFGFVVGGVYVLVYGAMLRFVARGLTAAMFYLVWKPRTRLVLLVLIVLCLVVLALSPVYLPPSMRTVGRMNILRLTIHFPFLK